jgi:hypothetical protein
MLFASYESAHAWLANYCWDAGAGDDDERDQLRDDDNGLIEEYFSRTEDSWSITLEDAETYDSKALAADLAEGEQAALKKENEELRAKVADLENEIVNLHKANKLQYDDTDGWVLRTSGFVAN